MLKKLLNLLADAAVYGSSTLVSQVIGFVLLRVYTEYLSPADYFVIAMLTVVTTVFTPLANLGMINAVFRRFNLDKSPENRSEVFSTALVSVLVCAVGWVIAGWFLAAPISTVLTGNADVAHLVQLSLISAAFTTVGTVPVAILRADRRVKAIALFNLSKLLITVACTLTLVVQFGQGVRGFVVGTLLGEAIVTLVQFAWTFQSFNFAPSRVAWRAMISYGLPFLPHQLQTLCLMYFGQYWVGHMLGESEGGIYGIAVRFALPVSFVVNSIQNAWVPFKFQVHANDENPASFFRTAVTYYLAGVIYLWVGVSYWGPELLWIMTTKPFHQAAALVAFAALVPLSQGIYYMMGTGIELSDNTRPYPIVSFAALVVAVGLAIVLVPRLGAAGAALATASASLTMAVVIYYFSQQRFVISYDWPTMLSLLFLGGAAVAMTRWSLYLPAMQRLSLAVAVSLVFPCLEFAILARSSTERHRMRILWSRISGVLRRRAVA